MRSIKVTYVAVLTLLEMTSVFLRQAAGGSYSLLHEFKGTDGDTPSALIVGSDGNVYGTTRAGGTTNDGTIFTITPTGQFTTLYSFSGPDGIEPNGLVQDSDGSFYGTARSGGANNAGTIFRMSATNVVKLHDFALGRPFGGLVQARNGDFYGRSGSGEFRITRQGTFQSFPNGNGYNQSGPNVDRAGLTVGADGNLYGTQDNYPFGNNKIYQMTPDGVFTTLYEARGEPGGGNFYFPNGLVQGSNGNLYGKTSSSAYEFTPSRQYKVIHEFDYPRFQGPLIEGADGNVYGVAGEDGNTEPPSFLFKLLPDGTFTKLYTGVGNGGTLVQTPDGVFYGTFPTDGSYTKGTIFRVSLVAIPAAQLQNISTRLAVTAGDNVLIAGFIVSGTDQKKVIVRGLGPSLPVSGALADPTLELHDGSGATIAANDNWKEHQAEVEASTIPPTNDLESALVMTLPANNSGYTAILRGKNGTPGIGLVEVYDLDQAAHSRLANISTRGFVDRGDNVMIGGFIVGSANSPSTQVLVRAIGPTLRNVGITNALDDPALELHDGQGTLIASNNDWKDSQQTEISATTIPPANSRESAILRHLVLGNYTAIVRGEFNTTGVALVEVYDLQ